MKSVPRDCLHCRINEENACVFSINYVHFSQFVQDIFDGTDCTSSLSNKEIDPFKICSHLCYTLRQYSFTWCFHLKCEIYDLILKFEENKSKQEYQFNVFFTDCKLQQCNSFIKLALYSRFSIIRKPNFWRHDHEAFI